MGKIKNNTENLKWTQTSINEVATLINGKAYKQEELLNEGKYAVLRVGNFFTNNSWYYSDLELDEDKYVNDGDLMYAWSASFGPRYWKGKKTIYHYHIWKVIPKENIIKEYLFYYFEFDKIKIENNKQGGTMFHITKGDMEKRAINLPTLPEQKKIAQILSTWDEAIDTLEALVQRKERHKKALMQQLLTGKRRFKEFKGEKWEYFQLDKIADVRDGTHESPKYLLEGVKFITSKNIKNGQLDFSNISYISQKDADNFNRRSKVSKGDILMSMIGTIGNSVLVDFEPDFCIKNVGLIKAQQVNARYLIQYFHSRLFQNYLVGKLDGGIQKFISLSGLRELNIPIPSPREQTAIAGILEISDEEIQILKTQLEHLKQQKKGLMQVLLTGKIRVKV